MERVAWTDERLDDLAGRMDAGFGLVDRGLRELRSELRSEIGGLRNELRGEIGGLRSEQRGEAGSLRGEIAALRTTMNRVGGGIIVGLIVAVLTNSL
jgi:hypothetical protein